MQILSLGLEVPLEKEMATHSSILPWVIPWTEEPGGLHQAHGYMVTVHGVADSDHYLATKQQLSIALY